MTADAPLDSGRYRLGRLLGRGGLGEVYLAHDRTLDRDVAIKFLNPDKLGGDSARRALLREARAAAALDHPFICGIHEAAETDDGRAFIVMQHVEGQPLAELLQQHGPMPIRDALTLCAEVAEALGAAHRRGVIHRDLKPGNIIVTPSGHPKIVDFGIAKVTHAADANVEGSTLTDTTGFPALAGTPGYMSPEQLQGHAIDGRSDLFALGLVLFECLTGRRAFRAASPVETAGQILHVHPPPPSSLRRGLTQAHDELVRRLLAKDPADRFQSAEEVVGAIRVLIPDTSRMSPGAVAAARRPASPRRRLLAWAIAAVLAVAAGAGVWKWAQGRALPPVPADADLWYRRGSEALREGSYYRARRALERAIAIYPAHALAYARLAEVAAELDDPVAASAHLVRVSQLAVDERRLPRPEQLRLQAVRAIVLRDVDGAVSRYRSLVEETPNEPRAFVDLGRAQEGAGRRTDARASYERAIGIDGQYAAAQLRRGVLEGLDSHWQAALTAFAEAERLYRAASDVEGETDVLLNRGAVFDSKGEPRAARRDLERALELAAQSESIYQKIRAQLALSIVTASEGRIADAERLASAAVDEALANGLDTVAAGGLVDLAATLLFADKSDVAEHQLSRALELAARRGAALTAARARIQLAEVYARGNRSAEAVKLIDQVLPFVRGGRYRRHELTALSIAARAQERVGNLDEARRISSEVLAVADGIGDETQAANAAASLASVTTVLGNLPEALRLRDRADAIHRRQGDRAALPYDLTNRAELLIRLGRGGEAAALLDELDAGIAAGIESYVGRLRRATLLRALNAATELRCGDALPLLARLVADTRANDSAAGLAPALQRYCGARTGQRAPGALPPASPTLERPIARERQYWAAAAALQAGDAGTAASEAQRGLSLLGDLPNDELRWRLALVSAAAERRRGDAAAAAKWGTVAREALGRIRGAWKIDAERYERRPDLVEILNKEQS
ncbi:MAG TPA: protein kinase [Vicinamibacterales bacterium]|nr:protein kinase [Vicinamibacterales bacterium]